MPSRYLGTFTESPCLEVELPLSADSLRILLRCGADPRCDDFSHQQIAHWSRRFHEHVEASDSPELGRALEVAEDVDSQWVLNLANTYDLAQLRELDFSTVALPVEWFHRWIRELGREV